MFDEPFSRGTSLLHRLDPRIKLTAAFVLSCIVAVAARRDVALAALCAAAFLAVWSRPPVRPLLGRLAAVNVFVLFLWVVLPFTYGGVQTDEGVFAVSRAGVDMALLVTLKSNAIVLLFIACVATSDAAAVGHALCRLGVPRKLVFLFLFTYRYVHVLLQEYERLRTAARLRGFVPGTGLHTYGTLANMLGMVILRSLDRSQRVYEAMILRGFDGRFHSLCTLRLHRRDVVFGCGAAVAACMLVYAEFAGGLHVI
ncbi:cobalt ECF transporter T component CbiQ [Oleidesulfovibrio alaskensis]|uniref:cobalt ECF transporter T component CbiQ n=1 Tax=Oleidesulfovibrio alaskensis TaxID=58180 RepID=UPI00041A650C|nr:cobalt ECF transporter T component CbiQ [Oleidesulfovibrio alaskensis]